MEGPPPTSPDWLTLLLPSLAHNLHTHAQRFQNDVHYGNLTNQFGAVFMNANLWTQKDKYLKSKLVSQMPSWYRRASRNIAYPPINGRNQQNGGAQTTWFDADQCSSSLKCFHNWWKDRIPKLKITKPRKTQSHKWPQIEITILIKKITLTFSKCC